MTVRPARGALVALTAAVLLNLLTRATGDGWLALASAGAVGLLFASALLRPQLTDLDARLAGPDRVAVGQLLEQVLVVRNVGSGHSPAVTWTDRCRAFAPVDLVVPALAPGATVRVPLSRRALHRGAYDVPSADLVSSAPFGVLRWRLPLPASPLLVHPVPAEVVAAPAQRGRSGVGIPMGVAGTGLEVLGLRPWRPGDSARSVSARASARRGRPVVLEREQERAPGRTLLVLAVGGSSGPEWERVVSVAAGRALEALQQGSRVTLVGGPPVPRVLDRAAVLDFFARVDAAPPFSDAELREAARAIHPGGTLLLLAGTRTDCQVAAKDACCTVEVLRG